MMAWLIGGVTMMIMVIYGVTSYPTISWVDSGVIAAAAKTLGIANPPGFPLYMLVGHLFSLIPVGSVTFRLLLLSHIGAIAALFGVWWLVRASVEGKWREWAAGVAVVATAFSYSLWSQAGNVETFTVTNGVLMMILVAGLSLGNKIEKNKWQKNDQWLIWGLSLAGGLSLGLNPVVSALVAPGIWWLVRYRKIVGQHRGVFGIGAVLVLVGAVAIYSYLPIRAAAKPYLDWGDPVNSERIQKHLVGAGLNIYEPETGSINGFTGQPKVWWESFGHFLELGVWQFTPVLVPLVFWGGWVLFKKKKDVFWPLIAMVGVNLVYVVLYFGGNQENWMITSWLVGGVMIGVGANEILNFKFLIFNADKYKRATCVAIALIPLVFWWPTLNHSRYNFADDYVRNMYREVPEGSVVIGGGDYFLSVSLYNKLVTDFRSDIIPVTGNMFYIFDWYREGLRRHTDLVISPELEKMVRFKSVDEFTEVIDKLVADNPTKQFFVTSLLIRDTVVAGHKEGNYHTTKFELIPHGLLFKIAPKGSGEEPKKELYAFKALPATPFYLERNYKNAYGLMRNDYATAYLDLGDWYDKRQQTEEALKNFQAAAEWGATDRIEFWNRLAIFYAQNGKIEQARASFEKAKMIDPDNVDLENNWQAFQKSIGEAGGQVTTKEYRGKFSFEYPGEWKLSEKDGVVEVTTENGFGVEISSEELKKGMKLEDYINLSPVREGIQLDQGLAKIPGFDLVWVKLWSVDKQTKMEFFLMRAGVVFKILVGPSDSPLMRSFDQLVGTLN